MIKKNFYSFPLQEEGDINEDEVKELDAKVANLTGEITSYNSDCAKLQSGIHPRFVLFSLLPLALLSLSSPLFINTRKLIMCMLRGESPARTTHR